MPLTGKGEKIASKLRERYGDKWKGVFYGGVTKGRFKGVLPGKEEKKYRNRYSGLRVNKNKRVRAVLAKLRSKRGS